MIDSLDELFTGARVNLHGDVDLQMAMHEDGRARLLMFQVDESPDPEAMLVLDAPQIAHMGRVIRAMVDHGNTRLRDG